MPQYSQENNCWTIFLVKFQVFRHATLLKSGSKHRCFPVNDANFLRTAFSIEHLRWKLLCLLKREEEESMEQEARKKIF